MYTATKTGLDAANFASKRVIQKTPEDTRDLIGNKIAEIGNKNYCIMKIKK